MCSSLASNSCIKNGCDGYALVVQAREASVPTSPPAEEDPADGDLSTASKASSNYSKITDDGQSQSMNYRVMVMGERSRQVVGYSRCLSMEAS